MRKDEKKCPKCAEVIKKEAVVCKHCGHAYSAEEVAEGKRQQDTARQNGAIGCLAIVVLLVAVGMCSGSNDNQAVAPKEVIPPALETILTPQQAKELEEKNRDVIAAKLKEVRALPSSNLEGNRRLYAEISKLAPGNTEYASKRDDYANRIADSATKMARFSSDPETALEITKLNWEKGGFGNVQLIRMTVKNNAPFAIRDFELTCTHQGASGSDMDRNVRVIYVKVPAQGTTRVPEVNMGFINNQVATSRCEITDAVKG